MKERSEARPQALWLSKTKTGDWGKNTLTWKNQELSVGRVKYEMSINIQVGTLSGQTDIQNSTSGEAGLETNNWGCDHRHVDFFFPVWKISSIDKTRDNRKINLQVPTTHLQPLSTHGQSCSAHRILLK